MTIYGFGSGLVIPTAGVIAVSVDKNIELAQVQPYMDLIFL